MSSLHIHDGFEPYFAGREPFVTDRKRRRARQDAEDSRIARETGDDAAKSNADVNPGDADKQQKPA
jgi:hypothetical protein